VLVSFLYAYDFRRFGLRGEDLAKIRDIARKEAGR
jgi:hypothetical protein